MTNSKNSIPVFEGDDSKRDIYFFPEIGGSYAVMGRAVEFHSDDEGDPWSIFSPSGLHIATFCSRKSRISIWPFPFDKDGETPLYSKMVRMEDKILGIKSAVRYAWLKWPHSHKSKKECSVIRRWKKDLFYVPYNTDRHLYDTVGSYVVFDTDGKIVGKVEKSPTEDKYTGWHRYTGTWHDVIEEKGEASGTVVRKLLKYIEEEVI